jgi:hypothetical protein
MEIEEEIQEFALLMIHEGWTWEVLARDIAATATGLAAPLLDNIALGLSDEDRTRFAGYVPIVERPGETPQMSLARAKLMVLLGTATERLRLSNAIEGKLRDSPIFQQFPELVAHLDNDELLPATLFGSLPDALEYKEHVIAFSEFTPQFIRRRLSAIAQQPNVALRLRVANGHPIRRHEYAERLEEAIEFGVTFTNDLILQRLWQKHLPTVLRRAPPINAGEAAYDRLEPLDRLEVLRTERDGHISLLFEELVPLSESHIEVGFATTKIFHCDTDVGTGTFSHVDASQLVYRLDTYEQRLGAKMKDKIKADGHLKLFWLASCTVETWKTLLLATYPRNELVGEYLTGEPSSRFGSSRRG